MAKRKPALTSLRFFQRLRWIDGRPLLDTIESYRRTIFAQALDTFREDGTPAYNLVLAGRGKKNWKSADLVFAALYCTLMRRSSHGNNSLILASTEDQAGDDLELARKIIEANPELAAEFEVLQKELRLRDGSGSIRILPAGDAGGLHGKTFSFCGFDEIHNYVDWAVLEALQPDPTRQDALTWITSYDTYFGETGIPLHDLKQAGFAGTDPRMLFSWYSGDRCTDSAFVDLEPEERANPSMASWPDGAEYLEQQRRRLPAGIYRRLHLNLGGRASAFVDMADWEACVDGNLRPVLADANLLVFVGVDASVKRDSTAIVVVTFDHATQRVRVVRNFVFQPSPKDPLDFQATIEDTLRNLQGSFRVVKVLFDPYQMQATAQRLAQVRLPIEEF